MNAGHMPYGAREITELRAIGKRPADMVLVSLIGPLGESNPLVVAKPERDYDWRFLRGLDVLLVARSETDKRVVKRILDALLALPTEYLGLWLADRQNGINVARGPWRHRAGGLRQMGAYERELFAGVGQRKEGATA